MNNNKSYFIADIGNAFTKAIFKDKKIIFPSRLGSSLMLNTNQDILCLNDINYTVGSGIYNIKTEKFSRDDTLHYILAAIAKANDCQSTVVDYLVLALPLAQFSKYGDTLKEQLESNKCHSFTFNNIDIAFEYQHVIILPEAVAAYFGVLENLRENSHDTLIIDIGGGTTDIVSIDTQGLASTPKTLNIGSIKLLQQIASYIEDTFCGIGVVHVEKVQDYLKNGFYYNGELHSLDKAFIYTADDIKYIIQQLNTHYSTHLKTSTVVVIDALGLLYSALDNEYKDIKFIHVEDSFSNAYGMEIMIKSMVK